MVTSPLRTLGFAVERYRHHDTRSGTHGHALRPLRPGRSGFIRAALPPPIQSHLTNLRARRHAESIVAAWREPGALPVNMNFTQMGYALILRPRKDTRADWLTGLPAYPAIYNELKSLPTTPKVRYNARCLWGPSHEVAGLRPELCARADRRRDLYARDVRVARGARPHRQGRHQLSVLSELEDRGALSREPLQPRASQRRRSDPLPHLRAVGALRHRTHATSSFIRGLERSRHGRPRDAISSRRADGDRALAARRAHRARVRAPGACALMAACSGFRGRVRFPARDPVGVA